jgi:hypothetical protein
MLSDAEKDNLLECARFHDDLALVAAEWTGPNRDEQVKRHLGMAQACRAALREAN